MNPPSLIVLINLNNYLGGGETLMVRFAEYLQGKGVEFLCLCAVGSYVHADLQRKGIIPEAILAINTSPDYYYLDNCDRQLLVDEIAFKVTNRPVRFVSFCMRDLYTVNAFASRLSCVAIIHLILHIQDDLYVGQTITEKISYYLTGRRRFGNARIINFNRRILSMLNKHGGLICMADLIAVAWRRNFGINIPQNNIVPLPSFVAMTKASILDNTNRKIIWIGRLVDFKIPALLAMIDFLAVAIDYRLTIVGDGDRRALLMRMKKHNISVGRVIFLGEVPYAELGNVICDHSIGYAMGTSLIELARFRIPVIVALASYAHTTFSRPICGGLFFNQPRGCDGSELAVYSEDEIDTTIPDAVRQIEIDWGTLADACYNYARNNYAVEANFKAYEMIIEDAAWLSDADKKNKIPTAPLARRIIYLLKNFWQR